MTTKHMFADMTWPEVNEAVAAKHPFQQEVFHTQHAVLADGTIVDW